ncbi:MAG TPA: OsmC family protein, partial [Jatrophihabitans sp.]|nr:OsmC family protein [Jatrophihabitans sp.]
WKGNRGTGTSAYRAYGREHEITAPGRPAILGSADPAFRGDADRWSPEDLLVASLSQCHLLWYLHLAAESGVAVTDYVDHAVGTMRLHPDGSGEFTEVVLRPAVTVAGTGTAAVAGQLHERVHGLCFIARSVNFPVRLEPTTAVAAR